MNQASIDCITSLAKDLAETYAAWTKARDLPAHPEYTAKVKREAEAAKTALTYFLVHHAG